MVRNYKCTAISRHSTVMFVTLTDPDDSKREVRVMLPGDERCDYQIDGLYTVSVDVTEIPAASTMLPLADLKPDYPYVRRTLTCPVCYQEKDQGLVVCWPCYRKGDGRNGFTPEAKTRIQRFEQRLSTTD